MRTIGDRQAVGVVLRDVENEHLDALVDLALQVRTDGHGSGVIREAPVDGRHFGRGRLGVAAVVGVGVRDREGLVGHLHAVGVRTIGDRQAVGVVLRDVENEHLGVLVDRALDVGADRHDLSLVRGAVVGCRHVDRLGPALADVGRVRDGDRLLRVVDDGVVGRAEDDVGRAVGVDHLGVDAELGGVVDDAALDPRLHLGLVFLHRGAVVGRRGVCRCGLLLPPVVGVAHRDRDVDVVDDLAVGVRLADDVQPVGVVDRHPEGELSRTVDHRTLDRRCDAQCLGWRWGAVTDRFDERCHRAGVAGVVLVLHRVGEARLGDLRRDRTVGVAPAGDREPVGVRLVGEEVVFRSIGVRFRDALDDAVGVEFVVGGGRAHRECGDSDDRHEHCQEQPGGGGDAVAHHAPAFLPRMGVLLRPP